MIAGGTMPFTAEELRILAASDAAEDYKRPYHRREKHIGPMVCVSVRESIASLTDGDRQWMIDEGFIRILPNA